MRRIILLSAAAILVAGISGCAGGSDTYVYGHEVMSVAEVEAYRTVLATANGADRAIAIAEHNELVENRAQETSVSLKTEAQARPRRTVADNSSRLTATTGSRLGRTSGRVEAGIGGTANSISATPDGPDQP